MKTIQLAICLLLSGALYAQIPQSLTVSPFTDFAYENVEPGTDYTFDYPLMADILFEHPNDYEPTYADRYFMSIYGPRHKYVSTSNIGYFDFHKGADMTANVTYNGTEYDEDHAPDIHCVCDGEVYEIFTGPNPESTGTGKYITVKCDSSFKANPAWGQIYTAYRHLESIAPGLQVNQRVAKGDVVGVMGESGHTTTVHLHFSVIRRNTGSQINVHPMRLFNPDSIPHLVNHLTTAEITQLEHTSNEALFRMVVPYNMANIRAIEVSLPNGQYERIYDFEEVSILPEEDRDDNDAVDGLELYAYPFNRGHHLYRRVWDRYDDGQITMDFPASPDLGTGNFYPFLSEGLHQTPAYAMDIRVRDLPANYDISELQIKVIDIWGYGVTANGVYQSTDEHFAWSMIADEDDDVEEHEDGDVDFDSGDLELVYDGSSRGNQTVGLLFRDLAIPNSATITDAYLQFRADNTHDDPVNLYVKAEDSGTTADFVDENKNVSDRDTTYHHVHWQPGAWEEDDQGPDQLCPILKEVVQEVVTRQDWDTGSPLAFLITGNGRREAEGHNDSLLWKNAYVYVEYNDQLALPPNEPPTITITSPKDGLLLSVPTTINITTTVLDQNNNVATVDFYANGQLIGTVSNAPYELDWNTPDYGSYVIQATATDTEGLSATSTPISVIVSDNVVDIKISHKNDDVEEIQNGTVWKTNKDLELCYDSFISSNHGLVGHQHVGLRFQNVPIPQGATITNAYLQFTADETDDDPAEIIIRAEDIGNAPELKGQTKECFRPHDDF